MRIQYLSDLHLEQQDFEAPLAGGDALIVAGDLCHARCLDPARPDAYSRDQRTRVMRFIDAAHAKFQHVILIAGNHEHYDGVFEETAGLLRRHLPSVVVLDDETIELGGIRIFGSTLWSDFGNGSAAVMDGVRRRMGEYFFVKTRCGDTTGREDGQFPLGKFGPERALRAHVEACSALVREVGRAGGPIIVVTHHAPSRQGLNPRFMGNDLDAAYASDLDDQIAAFRNVPVWIHGHTHIARSYRIGETTVRSNARGFASKGHRTPGFSANAFFEIEA